LPRDDGATAHEVAKHLKLDRSTAWRRLGVAMNRGFVFNMETRKGQPGKYRLTDQEVEAASLLPSVEEIRAYESSPPATPPKPAQPRNRSEFDDEDQRITVALTICNRRTGCATGDSGCVVVAAGCKG
jgi:hypothetical protein